MRKSTKTPSSSKADQVTVETFIFISGKTSISGPICVSLFMQLLVMQRNGAHGRSVGLSYQTFICTRFVQKKKRMETAHNFQQE
jgi:hypothetical protein